MRIKWKELFVFSTIVICGSIAALRFAPYNFSVQEASSTETISAFANISDNDFWLHVEDIDRTTDTISIALSFKDMNGIPFSLEINAERLEKKERGEIIKEEEGYYSSITRFRIKSLLEEWND